MKVDQTIVTIAAKLQEHAKGCKKPLSDCSLCQRNVEWFANLPLPVLAEVLVDKGPARKS